MDRECVYEIPLPFLKRIFLWHIWKTAGLWLLAMAPIFAVCVWFVVTRETKSFVAYTGIVVPVIYWGLWAKYYSQSIAHFSEAKSRQVRLKVADDSLTFQTDHESAILRWPAINHIWRTKDGIILGGGKKPDWLRPIPRDPVGDELLEFIVEKIRSEGDLHTPIP